MSSVHANESVVSGSGDDLGSASGSSSKLEYDEGTKSASVIEAGDDVPQDSTGQSGSAASSMQVIDFLDAYTKACSAKNAFVITSLRNKLQDAIDGGAVPSYFNISGKGKELRHIIKKRLDDDYAEIIMTPMAGISFLSELDLSFNEIGDRGAIAIANFLKGDRFLRMLSLKSNSIGSTGGMAIAKALQLNEALQYLDVSYNSIKNDGGMEFAAMLQINISLNQISLAGCDLAATSLIAIFTVLHNNSTLDTLDISNNESNFSRLTHSLQSDVMMHLSRMLKENTRLRTLRLSKMGITDWSMVDALAGAFKNNKSIRNLDLACNRISRDGGVAICQALYKQSYVTRLSLSCCAIQDEGAEAVAVMLLFNRSITRLYLDNNKISGKGLRAIAQSLQKNTTLTHITLWGNNWDVKACEDFAELVGGPVRSENAASVDKFSTRQVGICEEEPTFGLEGKSLSVQNLEDEMLADVDAEDILIEQRIRESLYGKPEQSQSRLNPKNIDVVFYSVGGTLNVARNRF